MILSNVCLLYYIDNSSGYRDVMYPQWLINEPTDFIHTALVLKAGRGVQHESWGLEAAEWKTALSGAEGSSKVNLVGLDFRDTPLETKESLLFCQVFLVTKAFQEDSLGHSYNNICYIPVCARHLATYWRWPGEQIDEC